MTATLAQHAATSIEQLREIINSPAPDAPAMRKDIGELDDHCRAFIQKSPFLLLSTSGPT